MSMSSSAAAPASAKDVRGNDPQGEPQSLPEIAAFLYEEVALDHLGRPLGGPDSGEKIRRMQAEAFEQGRKNAEDRLRAEVQAALDQYRSQLLKATQDFARERQNYYQRIEPEVVELALAIARKILHREAQLDPHALAGMVRVTLEKLDAGTEIHLKVHPREAAEWRHYFACQIHDAPVPEVHDDPELSAGECRIETSMGTTQIGFESQLKEIETGLLDLLAERPNSTAANEQTPGHRP